MVEATGQFSGSMWIVGGRVAELGVAKPSLVGQEYRNRSTKSLALLFPKVHSLPIQQRLKKPN